DELQGDQMMLSPAYAYEKAPDQEHFPGVAQARKLFSTAFADGRRKHWRLNHTPLFLDFLEGKVDFQCTPWGIPSYSLFGWQRPCYLTAEALLAADVSPKSVQQVAGGNWWPQPPAFDTVVFQSDPQPRLTTGLTYVQLGGDSTITATLYAFRSSAQSLRFLLYAELVGPAVDEKNPDVGDRRAYYTTRLPSGKPATRLYFTRGPVGVSIEVNGQGWSASK